MSVRWLSILLIAVVGRLVTQSVAAGPKSGENGAREPIRPVIDRPGATSPTSTVTRIETRTATIESMGLLDEKQKLANGDRVRFRIVEDREEPKELFVTDSGELEVPYIGRVAAAGKTCKELGFQIKSLLEREYYYQATVILAVDLLSRARGKIYLSGQVRAAGPQDLPSDEELTVSKAIMRAGGFADFADKKRVKITRASGTDEIQPQTIIVDVAGILEKGNRANDVKLKPGDLIYVPSKLFNL